MTESNEDIQVFNIKTMKEYWERLKKTNKWKNIMFMDWKTQYYTDVNSPFIDL